MRDDGLTSTTGRPAPTRRRTEPRQANATGPGAGPARARGEDRHARGAGIGPEAGRAGERTERVGVSAAGGA
ncbi:hypothetical protein GCM10010377_78000 [Streptomyces viridiviolaceus]|nr:hypothetical protein GCM10010377_78000 [Streptomyces viridiviolaceus]